MEANQDFLFQHVKFLTELRPFRNYQNRGTLERVYQYLRGAFAGYGLQVTEQPFQTWAGTYKNIIGTYNPSGKRRLVVGAHFDVCGDQPGADDNASAVAGLLESARMVGEAAPALDYRIDFVGFNLEEPPFYQRKGMGSLEYAESIRDQGGDVIGCINFEMIGYFHEGRQPYPGGLAEFADTYPATADFIAVVGIPRFHEFNQRVHGLMRAGAGIDVQLIDDPRVSDLASMSDQWSFWKFGIPALMINDTAMVRNPNYHEPTDSIETLSFPHMREVVSSAYRAIVGM